MKRVAVIITLSLAILGLAAAVTAQGKWKPYKSTKHFFEMQVPNATKLKDKTWDSGWAGVHAKLGIVHFWSAHNAKKLKKNEIEQWGVKTTKIPAAGWKAVGGGKNKQGFEWFKVVEASKRKRVVYGAYGVGPNGSYVMVLATTRADFNKNRAGYAKFIKSLKVF